MSTQPEALRLANLLETDGWPDAAFELRRLEAAHGWQYALAEERLRRIEELEQAARQALEAVERLLFTNSNRVREAAAALRQALGE
jgi:hypothetical protein